MKIKDIFPKLYFSGNNVGNISVEGISNNTKFVKKGDLFFIIEGDNFDIFSFLSIIEHKVVGFVAEEKRREVVNSIVKRKPVIFVPNIKEELKRCTDLFYPVDLKRLKFIGVTGTNGKTTVTSLISYLLNKFSVKNALIGTIHHVIGDKKLKSFYTTPDYLCLRKLLYYIQREGIEYVIMEVSSHSIQQKRIEGINFLQCIFTNLTCDHLDYHLTMHNYFSTKERLFVENPSAISIINIDDRYGKKIFCTLEREKYSYGFSKYADYRITDYKISPKGVDFMVKVRGKKERIKNALIGRYNILNILASLVSLDKLGFSIKEAGQLISSFRKLDGRMERVGSDIFVDYAHTPDALRNALIALRNSGYKNIILVFGCGGNRDTKKREKMGKIACLKATFTIITSDNPRNEDPLMICQQIKKGFLKDNFFIIVDRKEAIKKAFSLKEHYKNCAMIVAGKGHEDYQIIGNKQIRFKDKYIIKELIKERNIMKG